MLTAAAVLAAPAAATEMTAASDTVMTVGEMCGGCVKRIEAKLKPMPGIAGVSCDIPTQTVTVRPKANRTLSPKALWEAMEAIGKTPKRLAGPSGVFTKKPSI